MHARFALALALLLAVAVPALAQPDAADTKWNVNAPFGPTSEVAFTTTEGTWMSLDVSPDGREIVFDLMGNLYLMPIEGGEARRLTDGPAWDVQPRFSPDGRHIAFTSDREGGDNIFVMNRDGSDARGVTREDFRLLNNVAWTPDGNYLIARKHFTGTRSLGAGEMWMYHVSGGAGLRLTERRNDQQDAGEPVVSPDGRYLYFSADTTPGPMFQYNKDPHAGIYSIRRLDLETGDLTNYLGGPGGAARPQPSPDGRHLAFVRRVRDRSVLFLHDLQTGAETPVYDDLYKDQQETWAVFGVYPGFAWTPDSREIVFWANGKLHRLDVASRQSVEIPFSAEVRHPVTEALRFEQEVHPETFTAKMIRNAVTSPDGRHLVFNAVGNLWTKRLPDPRSGSGTGGTPQRLTPEGQHAFFPTISPDSRTVVYVGWTDEGLAALYAVPLAGGTPRQLTERPGYYRNPQFSADGSRIVFERTGGNRILGTLHGLETGIYVMDASGGEMTRVNESGREPRFNRDASRVFFLQGFGLSKTYRSVRLDGGDERTHFELRDVTSIVPSPDEEWVAFTELHNAYIAPFPKTGGSIELSANTRAIPVTRVTRDAGDYLHWSGDGRQLHWTIGPEYFSRALTDAFAFLEGAPETLPEPDERGLAIGLELTSDRPSGTVAFTNARIVTMRGDEVIEGGTLVVTGNRIAAVGSAAEVSVPAGAHVVDAAGQTLMPGLIDVHAHVGTSGNGISPQQSWSYFANVAFGVTTAHDPSANTEMIFSEAEMIRAGRMVGPRLFSTGRILYGADGDFRAVINSLDDARSHLRRMKAVGAFSVKSYNQPRRNQRQQVLQAARELEMMVVPEGGSFFQHNMNMVVDGHTGIEHSVPLYPLYDDVVQLWGQTGVAYTPTLVVGYGGLWGEEYWYQESNVWEHDRLLTFTPRQVVDARSIRRTAFPDWDANHVGLAEAAARLQDAGVGVQLGAHGQLQGLAAHWELWMFEQGGMSPLQAIRAATLDGARYLGLDGDIGSLETGKLADVLVIDGNPLEDLRQSEHLRYVMLNGRLYDPATMHEVGPRTRERQPFWFEREGSSDASVWQTHAEGPGAHGATCHGAH